jgi:hypothetical protein
MKSIFIFILLVLFQFAGTAQNKTAIIDSLNQIISAEKNGTSRVLLYAQLSKNTRNQSPKQHSALHRKDLIYPEK